MQLLLTAILLYIIGYLQFIVHLKYLPSTMRGMFRIVQDGYTENNLSTYAVLVAFCITVPFISYWVSLKSLYKRFVHKTPFSDQ